MSKVELEAAIASFERWTIVFTVIAAVGAVGLAICAWKIWSANAKLRPIVSAEIAQLKKETAQANEKAEAEKLARVKIEERLAPRRLSKDQQSEIVRILKTRAGQEVAVFVGVALPEASSLWKLISELFTLSGWKIVASGGWPVIGDHRGVIVALGSDNSEGALLSAKTIIEALNGGGLETTGPLTSKEFPMEHGVNRTAIRVVVGEK